MIKIIKIILSIAVIVILALAGWQAYRYFQRPEEIEVLPSRPGDVKEMVRLCSMEIYNEVPVLDTVNAKVIFAVQKQNGSISFDVENLKVDETSDTIMIQLPREIVEVYESTEKDSWQVIDTKAIGPMAILRSDKLTLEEENRVKAKLKSKAIKRLYANGSVRKARKDAVENLTRLMEAFYRRPVIVTDPTPAGNPPVRKTM